MNSLKQVIYIFNNKNFVIIKMNLFSSKKRVYTLFGVLSLLIILSGYWYFLTSWEKLETERFDALKYNAVLKTIQIINWNDDIVRHANELSENKILVDAYLAFNKNRSPENKKTLETYLEFITESNWFINIVLISDKNEELINLNKKTGELLPLHWQTIEKVNETKQVVTTDLYRISKRYDPSIDYITPLLRNSEIKGYLLLQVNPRRRLYSVVLTRLDSKKTSETLLFRRDGDSVLYLNNLRLADYDESFLLKKPVSDSSNPGVAGARGVKGKFLGKDYRGKEVYSWIIPVPRTNWIIATKVDKSEIIDELIAETVWIIAFTILLISIMALFLAYNYNKKKVSIFTRLWKTEGEFKTTLYSIGEAIIVTNIDGQVQLMNHVAEKLTGWKEQEAKGHSFTQVAEFISEDTGEKTFPPIYRSVTEGISLNLGTRLLLRKKDGSNIPVDGTIAAVVNTEKVITGVIVVFSDQTENRERIKELTIAKNKAEEMNRVKSSFFTNMSHELRTPFIGILGFTEILEDRLESEPDIQEMANGIRKSANRLLDTLENLLTFSRIENSRIILTLEEKDILPVIKKEVEQQQEFAIDSALNLEFKPGASELIATTDIGLVRVITSSIIKNGIKFTEKGFVRVEVFKNDLYFNIVISDSGTGIPVDKQELIFEEFRQVSEGMGRDFEGAGLGLTVAKKYAEVLGGNITVKSEVGKGSVFTILLPLVSKNDEVGN